MAPVTEAHQKRPDPAMPDKRPALATPIATAGVAPAASSGSGSQAGTPAQAISARGGESLAPQRPRRPFEGWGTAAARGLRAAGRGLAHVSVLLFGHVKLHSGKAYADFQRRARHTRYRAYALGSYALIAAATLGAQLYEPNSIGAYVRVEKVDFPAVTAVFVRNDSDKPWRAVRVLLNGKYKYEPLRIEPHEYKVVRVDRFLAVERHGGKTAYAPRETEAKHLLIECDRGRFETELR